MRNIWYLAVLATLLATIVTLGNSNEVRINNGNLQRLKVHDVKTRGKKMKTRESEFVDEKYDENNVEVETKTVPNLRKVILMRTTPGTVNNRINYANKRVEERRVRRNVTNESKWTKKSQKKLKQTQAGYKNWKKDRSGDLNEDKYVDKIQKKLSRRHADYFMDNKRRNERSKRYAVTVNTTNDKTDYYAQRKAVMDRFRIRQKEIAEKYANRTSITSKYEYKFVPNTNLERNNASNKIETNNVERKRNANNSFVTSTSTIKPETNNIDRRRYAVNNDIGASATEAERYDRNRRRETSSTFSQVQSANSEDNYNDASDEYEDYEETEDKKSNSASAPVLANNALNDEWQRSQVSQDNSLKWGSCKGNLVYQHNFNIRVNNAKEADADISTTLEGAFCITCIVVTPVLLPTKAQITTNGYRREDNMLSQVKLKFKGIENEKLMYIVQMWAVNKINNSCDHVPMF